MLYPRDPKDYSDRDGECSERDLRYYIWYKGAPRKIGDLSVDELRGALLDAQDDLNIVCLKLYKAEIRGEEQNADNFRRALDGMNEAVTQALRVAKRHRVFSEEEDELP